MIDSTLASDQRAVPENARPLSVAYLTTTFPKVTETFLQREIRALRMLPVDVEIFSLWGGQARFEGMTIRRFPKAKLISLLWLLPYWMARKPGVFAGLLERLVMRPMPSWKNLGETLIGIGFALTHASRLSRGNGRPDLIHAAWATMPATAAQLLAKLSSTPFTMGAHAYDVYQDGGDCLMSSKLEDAALVVTSTEMVREELVRRGADPEKVAVVRRGLYPFPNLGAPRARRERLRILSVARLVEKKGVSAQLDIFAEMLRQGVSFEARLIGDGPLAGAARERADRLGLVSSVRFLGQLPFEDVLGQYAWADVLVVTGMVAADGDRDGLPNVVLEAMATGTPVVARRTSAVAELVQDGRNGVLLPDAEPAAWVRALERLRDDDAYYRRIVRAGRLTVEEHGNARANARSLLEHFSSVASA